MVRISGFHPEGPGSIPGVGTSFFFFFFFFFFFYYSVFSYFWSGNFFFCQGFIQDFELGGYFTGYWIPAGKDTVARFLSYRGGAVINILLHRYGEILLVSYGYCTRACGTRANTL